MPSPLRKLLSFVAEKRQVLKAKLDEARKKHLKRSSNDSDSRHGGGSNGAAVVPAEQHRDGSGAETTVVKRAAPVRRRAFQVHHTRYASDHPYESDPRRWVRRSNSSSGSSSVGSRRRSGSPGPPGSGSVLYKSTAGGGGGGPSPGVGGSPTSQPRSVTRSSGASSSNSRRNSNYSDDGVLLVADVDDGAPSLSPPLTVLRLQDDDDPSLLSPPPGLLSGWSREGVSEREIMAILLSPVQQRIALKMMLGEAMRFSWQLQVAHWQYCPQPLAVPQLYSTGAGEGSPSSSQTGANAGATSGDDVPIAALDMETLWFEFDCVWRTLVSDVFHYLDARTQRPAPIPIPHEVTPEEVGFDGLSELVDDALGHIEEEESLGDEPTNQPQAAAAQLAAGSSHLRSSKPASRGRDVLQWSVALAEVVQVLHTLDLFQRLHPVQQDVSVMMRKWADYYQEYQRYTERITEQYYASCGHPSPASTTYQEQQQQPQHEQQPQQVQRPYDDDVVVAVAGDERQRVEGWFPECPAEGEGGVASMHSEDPQAAHLPDAQHPGVPCATTAASTATTSSTEAVVVRLAEGDVFGSGQPSSCGQTPSNGGSVGYLHSSAQLMRYQSYYHCGTGEQEAGGSSNTEDNACVNPSSGTNAPAAAVLPVVAFHVPPPPQPPSYLDIPSVKVSMALAKKRAKEERRIRKQQEAPPSVILMGLGVDGTSAAASSPNGCSSRAKDTLSGTLSNHSDTLSLRRSSLRAYCPDEDSPYLALSWAAGNSASDRHRVIAVRRRRRLHAMLAANAMVGY